MSSVNIDTTPHTDSSVIAKAKKANRKLIARLLRRNTSPARIAGFLISNLVGLAIMAAGLQFYLDARSLWEDEDSFLKSDYLAINKRIDADAMWRQTGSDFSDEEIADLEKQPWVEKVGRFSKADFRVYASMALNSQPGAASEGGEGGASRRMSTAMFFEAVPDEFLDLKSTDFNWNPSMPDIPIIISKDYLALYNFGFASSAGLPKLSESLISGLPLQLSLLSDDGSKRVEAYGRIVGYSNRFNTILVPKSMLDYYNSTLTSNSGQPKDSIPASSRLIVDVNSPGDAAIAPYLESKGWEVAGDKNSSSAAYMLRVVSGVIIGVGSIITLLSLFILALSMSLLMEKNKRKLHSLLMLGTHITDVARPYWNITALSAIGAGILAWGSVVILRQYYLEPLRAIGAEGASMLWSTLLILILTLLIIFINCRAITRRVLRSFQTLS